MQMLLLASMNPTLRLNTVLRSALMFPKNLDTYKGRAVLGDDLPRNYYLEKALKSSPEEPEKLNISAFQQLFKDGSVEQK